MDKLRKEIDQIDQRIIRQLARRLKLVEEIGAIKARTQAPLQQVDREEEILQKIFQNRYEPYLRDIYQEIFRVSTNFQRDFNPLEEYGLLGKKLSHSYSREIHQGFGSYLYSLFEVAEKDLDAFMANDKIKGFNVTIPYKARVLPYLDQLSPEAQAVGNVNTVYRREGKLYGANTDIQGFETLLDYHGFQVQGRKVLLLGNGASAKTVRYVLNKRGAHKIFTLSRRGPKTFKDAGQFRDAQVIINCTPVGMYPNNGQSLISLQGFLQLEAVIDLVYNPLRTRLVLEAMKKKIPAAGGLAMLVAQAIGSYELFTGQKDISFDTSYQALVKAKENIVIVGMPGSGKTSLARRIAKVMKREFIDSDREIRERYGNINPIIKRNLQEFRRYEHEIITDIGKTTGAVISTGGGSVTTAENYEPLKQNGTIFFIKRNIRQLSTRNRPISQQANLHDMYRERYPLYQNFSDIVLKNRNFKACVDEIIGAFYEYPGH